MRNPNEKEKLFPFTAQIVSKFVVCKWKKKKSFRFVLSVSALSYWTQFSFILIRGDVFSRLRFFFYENHPILYRSFGGVIATLYMLIRRQQQADSVSGTWFPTMYAQRDHRDDKIFYTLLRFAWSQANVIAVKRKEKKEKKNFPLRSELIFASILITIVFALFNPMDGPAGES